jgi:hypothetical protein
MKILIVISVIFLTVGCGTKIGTGVVDVQFENSTGSVLQAEMEQLGIRSEMNPLALLAAPVQTPDVYQLKLVAIYLVENIDSNSNNVGALTRIWTSRKCDADLTLCGIGPSAGAYIVDYFDFAAGTTAVNQTLASYRRDTAESTVNAGTYRYIRIDFTGATGSQDPGVANLKFGMTGDEHEVRAQIYGSNTALPTPLVLGEGENFTVELAYDLANRYYDSADSTVPQGSATSNTWTCDGSGGAVPCIIEAQFTPTVTKN